MWRSISTRTPVTINLGRKLFSVQNPPSNSSHFQVFHHKCFNSSSYFTDLFSKRNPRTFTHQNLRFMSHSDSVNVASSQDLDFNLDFARNDGKNGAQMSGFSSTDEVTGDFDKNGGNSDNGNDAVNVNSSQDLIFSQDFDRDGGTNGAQMSGFSSIDEFNSNLDGNCETSDAQMKDFDGKVENNDARISGASSINEKLVEGISSGKIIDVEKLENVVSLLQSNMDGSLETSLDGLELSLNEEFLVRVIETPLVPGEYLIRFFKWASSKDEFEVTTAKVLRSLARVICNTLEKNDAYAFPSGAVSVELLNQLICVFSELGKGKAAKAAFEVFGKFDDLGCVPNVDTYYLTIKALCKCSFYDWAALVSEKMLDAGMVPDSEKVGSIIYFFCRGLRSKEAYAVYLAAKQNYILPQRTVNFLIRGLSKKNETVPFAKEMLADFSCEARKRAIGPFTWVIRGLCWKKDIEGGKKLLLEMIEKGPCPRIDVFNTVINALAKAGKMEDAKEMVKLVESRRLKPDAFSYAAIIKGYANEGFMDEACEVLSEARKNHPNICAATSRTLIRDYCKLEQFDKAVKLLSDMKKYGVEPNVDEYDKLIQSLRLKALDRKTSEKLLEEMKAKGMHLPGISGDRLL